MSILSQVTKGKVKLPHLVLLYGPDGVGKSTFAASAPSPLFIGTEKGTANLDVARAPSPKTFADVIAVIDELRTAHHDFKTVVLDSLDWLEPMVWAHACAANGWANIEAPGYGKGYIAANGEWMTLRAKLDMLRDERKMNVILIAHSLIRTFQDPQNNVGYDRYQLKLNEKAAALFREFVDSVLFANYEVFAKKDKGEQKGKAYGDGARFMYSERRPAFDAKNRHSLPFKLPLSWDEYVLAIESHAGEKPEALIESIKGMLPDLADADTKAKAEEALKRAGTDPTNLLKLKNRIAAAVAA